MNKLSQDTLAPTGYSPEPTHRLLKLSEVRKLTALGRSALYSMAQRGLFPKPIKIGPRASAWVSSEVYQWIDDSIAVTRRGATEIVQKGQQ